MSHVDTKQQIKDLIHSFCLVIGGMKITSIHLELVTALIFLKRVLISYLLRVSVQIIHDPLCEHRISVPIIALQWATPIATLLKEHGKAPPVCGNYHLILNAQWVQRSCIAVEPGAIILCLCGSCLFSKTYLKLAYL